MDNFKIEKYNKSHTTIWNNFIIQNKYTSFLFHRNFMEYHSARFLDFSFLIFEDEELICICPGNINGIQVFSHQGLTYGGLLFAQNFNNIKIENILPFVIKFFNSHSVTDFFVKGLPEFYNQRHSEIERELLLSNNAKIYRKDKVLAIDYSLPFTIHKTKLKNYRKNKNKEFVIKEEIRFSTFWNNVLIPRLREKHNAKPVHTLDEIELLKSRFPDKIKQFNIYLHDEMLAGITIFDKGEVVKSQYGATTIKGEKERALEYLFLHLIYKYKDQGKSFFSMGTVTENNELGYNSGLLKQKQELGCSIYTQDFYSLEI